MSDDPIGRGTGTVVRVTVPRNRQSVERVAGAVAAAVGTEVASVRSVVEAVKDLSAVRGDSFCLRSCRTTGPRRRSR